MRTEIITRSAASSTDFNFVLASLNPPKCWNLYETMEAAQADMPRANAADDEIAARDAREAAQRESMQFVCIRLLTDEETAKVFNGTAVAV